MPIWRGIKQFVDVNFHRYKCNCCGKTFNEDIGLKTPETRMTISAVSAITGIHWNTISKIHSKAMKDAL